MRRNSVVLAVLAVSALAAFGPAPVGADATATCPDHMTPVPEQFVHNGEKKDHNDDGFVCAKPAPSCVVDGTCNGGRDYDVFGVPLLGMDGNWYYVTDNILP